jgi:hypothetical protein
MQLFRMFRGVQKVYDELIINRKKKIVDQRKETNYIIAALRAPSLKVSDPAAAAVEVETGAPIKGSILLADLLRRHDSAGAICVDRPDMAASLFMTMVLGGPIRLVGSPQPMSAAEVDDWVRAAVRLFLNGIRTRSD